ncbi:MAG: dTMP kinase [Planctomycetes bacterium]|nr:dTMP kinase [Planctomycetota bacterium]
MVDGDELGGLAGAFIVLDGVDGSGKTTVQRLVADEFTRAGHSVTTCKDPGGTEIGNRIRSVLLDHDLTNMSLACETLLFMASRAQLVAEVIEPALANGHVVLCDRYVSSTCAYQGAVGADTHRIIELANYATGGEWPDLTVVIDVPVEMGFQRIGRRANGNKPGAPDANTEGTLDAMERRPTSFHQRVRQNFLGLREFYPARVVVIDGTLPPEQVAQAVLRELAGLRVSNRQASGGRERAPAPRT